MASDQELGPSGSLSDGIKSFHSPSTEEIGFGFDGTGRI